MTTAVQQPQLGLQCIFKSINHFRGVPAFTQQAHSSKRHPAPYRKEENSHPRILPRDTLPPCSSALLHVLLPIAKPKRPAVAGRHTSAYPGGKQPCQDCPLQTTPSDRSVSAASLPHYPQQGQWDRSSQTHLWFPCPTSVHQCVALTFLGRHKQTSVHLDRELMADSATKFNSVNQGLA